MFDTIGWSAYYDCRLLDFLLSLY